MRLTLEQRNKAHSVSRNRFFGYNYAPMERANPVPLARMAMVANAAGEQAIRAVGKICNVYSLEFAPAMLIFGHADASYSGVYCVPWIRGPFESSACSHGAVLKECARELHVRRLDNEARVPSPDGVEGFAVRNIDRSVPGVAFFGHDYEHVLPNGHRQAIDELAQSMPDVSYFVVDKGGLCVSALATIAPPDRP